MQPREKKLLFVLLGVGAVLLIALVVNRIANSFDQRKTTLTAAKEELQRQQMQLAASRKTIDKRTRYEARSLPSELSAARSLYQQWLFKKVADAGWTEPNVKALEIDQRGGLLRRVGFDVTARGTLDQIVKFLFDFYRAEHLHHLKRFNLTPIDKSRELSIDIGIEAISLPSAAQPKTLNAKESPTLAFGDLAEYRKVIETRNFFGPPNRAPTFAAVRPQSVKVGQPLSFTASARDEDPFDQLSYQLEGEYPAGAAIDPKSGRFTWTPPSGTKPGEFSATIAVTDTGVPSKTVSQSFKITVTPPTLKLSLLVDKTVIPGQEVDVLPRLTEQTPGAKMTYALEGDVPSTATFDVATGRLKFMPEAEDAGKSFTATIRVQDDAMPPHEDRRSFKITVSAPPKVNDLALDINGRFTFLTGMVDDDKGVKWVWFTVRTTGETKKVRLSDDPDDEESWLSIGTFRARLVEIRRLQVVLDTGHNRLIIPLGESLADYVLIERP